MKTALIPNVQVSAVATYGYPRPAWHAFVPQHPDDCVCRATPSDPWPSAPLRLAPSWTAFTRRMPTVGGAR